jgi:hypothetical protein
MPTHKRLRGFHPQNSPNWNWNWNEVLHRLLPAACCLLPAACCLLLLLLEWLVVAKGH